MSADEQTIDGAGVPTRDELARGIDALAWLFGEQDALIQKLRHRLEWIDEELYDGSLRYFLGRAINRERRRILSCIQGCPLSVMLCPLPKLLPTIPKQEEDT